MLPSRQPTVRVNQGYQIDSKWEAFALLGRGLRGLGQWALRWRTELLLLSVLLTIHFGLSHTLPGGIGWHWFAALLVCAGLLCWPRARRLVYSRLVCAQSRRRVLACCRETRVANTSGQLPRVIRVRTTPVGERLWLALRPGQSAELLEARAEEFRAAARARDVHIVRDPAGAHLVTVDVIRRDLLAGLPPVASPLLAVAHVLLADGTDVDTEGVER
jgi:hypothetical protein